MPKLEAAQRRDQVIRATYKAFIERGAANVTLEHIAEMAECSKGVVAYHFKSKEDVFVKLLDWLLEEIYRHIEQNVQAATGARAKMQALVDTIFLSARDNRRFFLVYLDFIAQGVRDSSFRPTNISFYKFCREINREIVELGIMEGHYRRVDPDEAGSVIRAIFDGLSIQWLFDESGPPDQTFERYKGWALTSIEAYLRVGE